MREVGRRALTGLVAVLAAGCLEPAEEPAAGAVFGGAVGVHPRVGLLSFPREWNGGLVWTTCTGTVVSPHVVITAAHCMMLLPFPGMPEKLRPYTLLPRRIKFQQGAEVQRCVEQRRARESAGEPSVPCGSFYYSPDDGFVLGREYLTAHMRAPTGCFDTELYARTGEIADTGPCFADLSGREIAYVPGDLAAVHFGLAGVKVDPPVPLSLATAPPAPGQAVELWGFGRTARDAADAGESRMAPTVVRGVHDDKVMILEGPRTAPGDTVRGATCSGDSGGPTFAAGGTVFMGVHSTGGPSGECGFESWDIRVDTYRPWICREIEIAGDPLPPECATP